MNRLVEIGKQGKQLRKEIALPPQHPDNSPSLQGDERSVTYSCTPVGRAGQKSGAFRLSSGAAGREVLTRTTTSSQYDGQGDVSGFFFPTHVHKHYSGCKVKN